MPYIMWLYVAINFDSSWVDGHIVKGFVSKWNQNVATKTVAICGFGGVEYTPLSPIFSHKTQRHRVYHG